VALGSADDLVAEALHDDEEVAHRLARTRPEARRLTGEDERRLYVRSTYGIRVR
jgi:hypothetical protein